MIIRYLKNITKKVLFFFPNFFKENYSAYKRHKAEIKIQNVWLKNNIKKIDHIKEKGQINIAFYANNISMWQYQALIECLIKDPRLNVSVLITPFPTLTKEANINNALTMKEHLQNTNVRVTDGTLPNFDPNQWLKEENPDLIFTCQPYDSLYNNALDWDRNPERIFAYYPYGIPTFKHKWTFNLPFHNIAWRFYCPNDVFYRMAKKRMNNKGQNLRLTGNLRHNDFAKPVYNFPWKGGESLKKIIFAPHFTIMTYGLLKRDAFLETAEIMQRLSKKYANEVQFTFKPHPRLKSELYNHPLWGKEKTDEYYDFWIKQPNTTYADGEYIDLFMTSDGMIHNSGSFTAEYMETSKPVMFISNDINRDRSELNDFGKKCLDNHYQGITETEIEDFIKSVIIGGIDPKKEQRETFVTENIKKIYGDTAHNLIYNDIITSFF